MSAKQHYETATPLRTNPRSSSAFTTGDLFDLNDPSKAYLSPLATIALIDMNAFFAQVEQIRLDLPADAPVVCAQWQSLIAVSYPARAFGISRMDTIESAKTKCPNLVVAHAAVFRKGESHWSYITGLPPQSNHKVSLDPYRRESRKIIRIFQEQCDLIEKASVDECYLDLGRQVYEKLIKHFPQLENLSQAAQLPKIPSVLPASLQWRGEIVRSDLEMQNELQAGAVEIQITDWDDICMLIGSQIMLNIRKVVFEELGYTTSGGLSRNKLMAKVAGGFKKPDNQTIIRTKSINRFLTNFELTDFTGMGGKIGDTILQKFELNKLSRNELSSRNSITYIREHVSLETLQEEIRNDNALAKKVYEIVRGDYKSEFTYRVDVKSMMSRKNFMSKKPVETLQDAFDWIRVFAGDLYNRMIEMDDENLNLSMSQQSKDRGSIKRPKTLSIHLSSSSFNTHSKQTKIPLTLSLIKLKEILEDTGFKLLRELMEASYNFVKFNGKPLKELEASTPLNKIKILPIGNLSLTISGFVKTSEGSLIDTYAGKDSSKEDIKKMFDQINENVEIKAEEPSKKEYLQKVLTVEDKEYINKLFNNFNSEPGTVRISAELENSGTKSSDNSKLRLGIENALVPSTHAVKSKNFTASKDPEYIKKLFTDFHKDSPKKLKSVTPEPKSFPPPKRQRADILQSLKRQKVHHGTTDSSPKSTRLHGLLDTGVCPECGQTVSDPIEHNDFHMAMELSEQMNGPT